MDACTKDNTKCILRHGLVYWFNAVAHCKFIHNLLSCLIKIHLPGIISFGIGDLHHPIPLHICEMVKEVLKDKRGVKLHARLLKLPSEFDGQLGCAGKEALTPILCPPPFFLTPTYYAFLSFDFLFIQHAPSWIFPHVYLQLYPVNRYDTVPQCSEITG